MSAPLFQREQQGGTRARANARQAIARACLEALEGRRLLSFSPAATYAAGASPEGIATADFNGDGRLDLAVANTSSDSVNVLLGNADGTFQPARTSAAGANPFSLAVGDFNADGTLDLAAGSGASGGGVNVMFGNRDGTFRAPANIAVGYPDLESVAAGDFNEDGKMDLVATSNYHAPDYAWYPQGRADVLLAIGDGAFAAPRIYWWPDRAFGHAVVADMNGDGNVDLVTELADYSTIIVLRGDGLGNFGGTNGREGFASDPSAAGDLNGDGKMDLVTSEGVLWGNGTGNFGLQFPEGPVVGSGPGSMVLADFDRDGRLDYAAAGVIRRNAGGGTFSTAESFAVGAGAYAVAAGDFDRDGWLDLATANAGDGSVSVLINDRAWGSVPPTVSVGDAPAVTEGNSGTRNATFTVTLSKPAAVDVTVQYGTADLVADFPALAGSDYNAASGTVTIPAGQTSRTFTVAVRGDRLAESGESFAVNLSAPTNASLGDAQAIGRIVDDEPRISINTVAKAEGNGKTTTISFLVSLSAAYDQAVTVNYATANGTATAGSDYQAKSGSVTFAPGETVKTITFVINGDKTKESNETFFVNLLGPSSNALISVLRGTGTILNDDRR